MAVTISMRSLLLIQGDTVYSMTMKHCFILIQGVSWPWSAWFKVFHDHDQPDSMCFMTIISLIQGVSWPWSAWFKVFQNHDQPDSRCFMTMISLIQGVSGPRNKMFHPNSTCFMVFHYHETNWVVADSSGFNMFHHCFIPLIHPVYADSTDFITVSPVETSLKCYSMVWLTIIDSVLEEQIMSGTWCVSSNLSIDRSPIWF